MRKPAGRLLPSLPVATRAGLQAAECGFDESRVSRLQKAWGKGIGLGVLCNHPESLTVQTTCRGLQGASRSVVEKECGGKAQTAPFGEQGAAFGGGALTTGVPSPSFLPAPAPTALSLEELW